MDSTKKWRGDSLSCTSGVHSSLHGVWPTFSSLQDLGNTNFSIHLPRLTFDRHATAQVILRAVRSLGVDAVVNDRNDICVGKEKISSPSHIPCSMY